jgi:hypothetical protein
MCVTHHALHSGTGVCPPEYSVEILGALRALADELDGLARS